MALDFFDDEKSKLDLAKVNMGIVIDEYNNKLSKLTIKQKNVLQLYFCFKVLTALKEMKPKGDYWNNYFKKKNVFKDVLNRIVHSSDKIFDKDILEDNSDLSSVLANLKVEVDRLMVEEKTGEGLSLLDLVNNFSDDIKKAYKEGFGDEKAYLYTVRSSDGLDKLSYINNRENQYWNKVYDGVYATGGDMNEIQMYIARAATGSGMKVDKNEIVYYSNPFKNIDDNKLILNKTVTIYMSSIDDFEPQFHYDLDKYGPRFIFSGEWVAPKPKNEKDEMYEGIKPLKENNISYLPESFLNNNVKIMDDEGYKTDVRELLGNNRVK